MMPHDSKLAEEMSLPTFCPHITQAVAMGLVSESDGAKYVAKELPEDRHKEIALIRESVKPVVYLSAYNGTYKALVRQTGWDEDRSKDAINSYWETNWSLKTIAEEQVVIEDGSKNSWLVSPITGFPVHLRSEKDRFNALCQSGGAFYHFNWIFNVLNEQQERWGRQQIVANVHKQRLHCAQ